MTIKRFSKLKMWLGLLLVSFVSYLCYYFLYTPTSVSWLRSVFSTLTLHCACIVKVCAKDPLTWRLWAVHKVSALYPCKHAHNSSLLPINLAEIDQTEVTTLPPTTAAIPAECLADGWQSWWCQNGGSAIYWPDRQYCGCVCAPGFTNYYCDG